MEDDNETTTPGLHFEYDPNTRGGIVFERKTDDSLGGIYFDEVNDGSR